ncbi:hypothetical protein SacmaDRAFT_0633 [Saccharomonospora marina XMU15]|uniref:Telomeric repeat-binding factor 2 n=1 Tax=Saccharomonospora marina XMU15 TaxID=882083 RepID=H5X5C2_9PSEU|nr:hypothetical protein [Saccharomonospora marina]EHR48933.1 hypothetical protein SacmaDRAFT_0633 [Saccharomonospora marina XMU15]
MKRALFILSALVGVVAIVAGCSGGTGGERSSPQQEYEQNVPGPEQQQTYADPTNVKWGEGSKVNGVYVEISQPRWTNGRTTLTYDVTVGNMSSWPVTQLMTYIYVDGVKVADHTTGEENPGYDLAILPGDGTTFTVARKDIPAEANDITMEVTPTFDAELGELPPDGPWHMYWSGPVK